jgi:F-type H+-transporting ATPase subunit c
LVQWTPSEWVGLTYINPLLGDFSVNKFARIAVLCLVIASVLAPAGVLLAADEPQLSAQVTLDKDTAKAAAGYLGVCVGAGLAAVGGGIGIGLLSASVVDASARQPEMQGKLLTTMFIAAALIEGLALFAIVVCILGLFM